MLALSGKIGAGRRKIRPAPKAASESLENSGVLHPQMLTHHPPGISAYIPAVFSASRPWNKPQSSSASARPGEKTARRRHRAAGRGPGRQSARPPMRDLRGAPPPGSSGSKPPSSISPAYSTRSQGADSRIPGHSWRTISPQGSGWPPFPHGSARAKYHLPPGLPKRD